jgi:hypothetical protein
MIQKITFQDGEKTLQIQKKETQIRELQEKINAIEASKFTSDSPLAQQDREEKTRLE